jgi:hypothetical protein
VKGNVKFDNEAAVEGDLDAFVLKEEEEVGAHFLGYGVLEWLGRLGGDEGGVLVIEFGLVAALVDLIVHQLLFDGVLAVPHLGVDTQDVVEVFGFVFWG